MKKGWCPGAHRPMRSGDGLILRVRPRLARLTAVQMLGLCDAASRYGSGIIELTSRANVQIRGVAETGFAPLLAALDNLGLIDADGEAEARRNVVVAPFWLPGDATEVIAAALVAQLGTLPPLPAKFGFSVDAGARPVLGGVSADVRIERGVSGGLIVRADGAATGRPVSDPVGAALSLARWFVENGGAAAGRMARLGGPEGSEAPAPGRAAAEPGATSLGPLLGAPFGQVEAAALAALVEDSGAIAVRVTPWRSVLLEGGRTVLAPGFVNDAGNRLMRVDACPGAPSCPAASVETRAMARAVADMAAAGHLGGRLHVSGCAKGCARAAPAAWVLVGRDGRYDLVLDGRAGDAPVATGLTREAVLARMRSGHALQL